MAENLYPVHMYKNLHSPRYAHDRKAVEAMTADGWTDVRQNIGPQEYPKSIYRGDGDHLVIGQYDKEGVVDLEKARAEEAHFAVLGYGSKPVAAPVAAAAASTTYAPVGLIAGAASRLDALEGDVAEIKAGMAEILAALTAKAPAKKEPAKKEHSGHAGDNG